MWIETPRAVVAVDGAGSGPKATVYRTLVFGRQALAEAVAEEPGIRFGPTVDRLMRTQGFYSCSVFGMYKTYPADSSLSDGMAFWAGRVFVSRLWRVSKRQALCRLSRAPS